MLVEQAADDTVALLQELADASDETPPAKLNHLLSRCVERVDLTFEAGKISPGATKPSRHRFVLGEVVVAEGLDRVRTALTPYPRPQPPPLTGRPWPGPSGGSRRPSRSPGGGP
jgi:hypothetical protein